MKTSQRALLRVSPSLLKLLKLLTLLTLQLGAGAAAGAAPDLAAARKQRLDAGIERLIQARDRGDLAACKAERSALHDDLHAEWTRPALGAWTGIVYCDGQPGGAWLQTPPSAEELAAAYAPMLAHFARMPPAERLQQDLWLAAQVPYWSALRNFGYETRADAQENQVLDELLLHAAPATESARREQARASLTQYAQVLYGARARIAHMDQLQTRLAQVLGAGHEATLLLMRTRVYALRQLQRPAQALVLSDELAALLAQHRPADERLPMLNRSERVGAFAALGRYADARAEGEALLAFLQTRRPRPHANLMRAAYNLAGLAIDMGALNDAVAFAELSVHDGLQASFAEGRQETHFARMLLHQARALRGDAGARADLRTVLDDVVTWDLPALGMLTTLHRLAVGQMDAGGVKRSDTDSDADTAQWALEKIRFVVAGGAAPLQPARALPLVLDAEHAAAGSAAGLRAAARAVSIGLAGEDPQAAVNTQFALARQAAPLQTAGAIWLYKRAANALLQLRAGLPGDESSLPRTWLAEHDAPLRQLVGHLIDAGRLKEAEQALDVLRDEELHDFRRRSRGTAARRAGTASLSATPDEAQRDLALLPVAQQMRAEALQAQARASAHSSERARAHSPDTAAAAAVDAAAASLQALALRPPISMGELGAPPPEPGAARARTTTGHARLVYVLRANGAEVLLSTPAGQQRISLRATRTDLNRTVQTLRAELALPGTGVPAAAQQLYDALLRPLAPLLRRVQHLHIVPDGALRYVPFASLHDGKRYLVQTHSVVVELVRAAAAQPTLQAPAARLPQRWSHHPSRHLTQVAGFGRSQPDESHAALPGVLQEMATLRALRGAQARTQHDSAFTAQALQAALLRQPDVVHLASHFVLDAAGEETSYLLLGDGQRLSLRALRQLPWQGVRLALLSACDTGLAIASGHEWAGFADALHAAGVHQVVASLWRVDDTGAARWMHAFYAPWRGRANTQPLSAAHLAATQRAWLRRYAGSPLAHPHHWAAFQWLGSGT